MSFDAFRKNANAANIGRSIEADKNKNNYGDGCWKISPNKETGTAVAKIRFLPSNDPETDIPYKVIYSHFFMGDDKRWCIVDRCNRTYGETCPICEKNRYLFSTGKDSDKEIARKRRSNKKYIFNILVIDDKDHPENNGKVFPFKCGNQIYEMIFDSLSPKFGEEPKNPFDMFEGHNFILRVRNDESKNNLPNYDKSTFEDMATSVAPNDKKLEEIYNQMTDLSAYVANSRKSNSELSSMADRAYSSCVPVSNNKSPFEEHVSSYSRSYSHEDNEPQYTPEDKLPWDDDPVDNGSETNDDVLNAFRKMSEE